RKVERDRRGPWPTTTRSRGAPSRLTIAPRPDQVSPTCRAPGGTPKIQFVEPICVAGVGPVHMPPQQLGAEEPVQGDARAFLGVTDDPLIPSLRSEEHTSELQSR